MVGCYYLRFVCLFVQFVLFSNYFSAARVALLPPPPRLPCRRSKALPCRALPEPHPGVSGLLSRRSDPAFSLHAPGPPPGAGCGGAVPARSGRAGGCRSASRRPRRACSPRLGPRPPPIGHRAREAAASSGPLGSGRARPALLELSSASRLHGSRGCWKATGGKHLLDRFSGSRCTTAFVLSGSFVETCFK